MNDEDRKQRSIFEDRFTGSVLKKKRRPSVVPASSGPSEPRARKTPTCGICSGPHYTRSCKVGK